MKLLESALISIEEQAPLFYRIGTTSPGSVFTGRDAGPGRGLLSARPDAFDILVADSTGCPALRVCRDGAADHLPAEVLDDEERLLCRLYRQRAWGTYQVVAKNPCHKRIATIASSFFSPFQFDVNIASRRVARITTRRERPWWSTRLPTCHVQIAFEGKTNRLLAATSIGAAFLIRFVWLNRR